MKCLLVAVMIVAIAVHGTSAAIAGVDPGAHQLEPSTSSLDTSAHELSVGVGVNAELDVLGISQAIAQASKDARNRDGFVKNVRNMVFYEAGQKFNVVVMNLAVDHRTSLKDVQYYRSETYNGVIYGIWVFKSGEFYNQGDGGFINWAYHGCVAGRVRGRVLFREYDGKDSCPTEPSVKLCIAKNGRCDNADQCCDNGPCTRKLLGPRRCR